MNAYRTVLVLCRAAIIALWMRAGLGLVAGSIMALTTYFGVFGTQLPSATANLLLPLGEFVLTAVVATLLSVFSPSLCASATGRAMLESKSPSSRRSLDAQEKALAWTGAGFILLFFAVSSILPAVVFILYALFSTSTLRTGGIGRDIMMRSFIPLSLHCVVGFVLAFRSDLRLLANPKENV